MATVHPNQALVDRVPSMRLMLSTLAVCVMLINATAVAQCPGGRRNDSDRDGVCNSVDNCPDHPNPDKADCDRDRLGNVYVVALCSPSDFSCLDCNTDGCGGRM